MSSSFFKPGHITAIIDLQAGSSGKGKLAAWLGSRDDGPDFTLTSYMPNAGHTAVFGPDGETKIVTKMLSAAGTVPGSECRILLGPDSVIDIERLFWEIEEYGAHGRVFLHPRAMVLRPDHAETERSELCRISSTMSGGGAARCEKVMRVPGILAGDNDVLRSDSRVAICDTQAFATRMLKQGMTGLLEISQGYDLDADFGLEYPYCTSRRVNVAADLGAHGLPTAVVHKVIGNIRPYPIRVGNTRVENGDTMDGYSGDYAGSKELSWEEVAERAGYPVGSLVERTTVTKRVRRVFEFNWERFGNGVVANGVTDVCLNFANYLDAAIEGVSDASELSQPVLSFTNQLNVYLQRCGAYHRVRLSLIGTGAHNDDMVELTYR